MSTFIYYQLYIFLATFYGGVVIGFMYDIYRIYRNMIKLNKIIAIIQDVLFWISISIVAISVLLYSSDGKLRGYSLIGFILGALLYNLLLSRIIVKTITKFLNTVKKIIYNVYLRMREIFRSIYKAIIYPCKKIYSALNPLILRIKRIANIPNQILEEIKKYSKIIFKKK